MVSRLYNMIVSLNFVLVPVLGITFAAENGDPCTTPNNETATCVPMDECKIIVTALATNSSDATDFAQKSQCGNNGTPLVCCGTSGYISSHNVFDIFTQMPEIVTPKPKITSILQSQNMTLANAKYKALPGRAECGIERESSRIIGGEITELDEFPWIAALEYKSKFNEQNAGFRCGGSVINTKFIVTAAHCILDREYKIISANLGEWRLSTNPDCRTLIANIECADDVVKVKIMEQLPHPYYSKRSGNNNIGLLRLENEIQYTDFIRPVCLPSENSPSPDIKTLLTIAGWGATENGTSSDFKLKVELPLVENRICEEKLGRPLGQSILCAGGERGKDSCRGDDGGPLMTTYQDEVTGESQWYQEGLVAFGIGCGREGYPAAYTRISRFVGWIVDTISEEE